MRYTEDDYLTNTIRSPYYVYVKYILNNIVYRFSLICSNVRYNTWRNTLLRTSVILYCFQAIQSGYFLFYTGKYYQHYRYYSTCYYVLLVKASVYES